MPRMKGGFYYHEKSGPWDQRAWGRKRRRGGGLGIFGDEIRRRQQREFLGSRHDFESFHRGYGGRRRKGRGAVLSGGGWMCNSKPPFYG